MRKFIASFMFGLAVMASSLAQAQTSTEILTLTGGFDDVLPGANFEFQTTFKTKVDRLGAVNNVWVIIETLIVTDTDVYDGPVRVQLVSPGTSKIGVLEGGLSNCDYGTILVIVQAREMYGDKILATDGRYFDFFDQLPGEPEEPGEPDEPGDDSIDDGDGMDDQPEEPDDTDPYDSDPYDTDPMMP